VSEEGRRYDIVPVTADIAIMAKGDTLGQLLANAAWGMMDIICDTATVVKVDVWEVEATSDDPESLTVDLLTEVLVLFETEGVLASRVDVDVETHDSDIIARARIEGEHYEAGRHELLHDIKAVTYHTLEVRPDKGYARVLFDI
jgi:SHS2 domain-containing protein